MTVIDGGFKLSFIAYKDTKISNYVQERERYFSQKIVVNMSFPEYG